MYYGFAYHTELIKQNMPSGKAKTAVELGVGTGHTVIELSRHFEKIYGFDISKTYIEFLKNIIHIPNVYLDVVDACSPPDKGYHDKFDFIFSIDTLEHVERPDRFFDNIRLLLKEGRTALVIFPNESGQTHHGVNWFDTKEELLRIVPPELRITRLLEVRYTGYFNFILNSLWLKPRSLIKVKKVKTHTFDKTTAFSINTRHPILSNLLAVYPYVLLKIAKMGKMFIYKELDPDNINNKYILMELRK